MEQGQIVMEERKLFYNGLKEDSLGNLEMTEREMLKSGG